MLHRISLTFLALLLLTIAASCGHGRNTTLPSTSKPHQTASSTTAALENALTQLDSLPCPAGVTAETWARVRNAFRDAAEGRLSEKAADQLRDYDDDTAVLDLEWEQTEFSGPVTLTWGYVLPGDYNQDGVVDITDLTPLAQNLDQSWIGGVTGQYYDSMPAVCDGDGDGTVDIDGDILKIRYHFDDTLAGYSVEGDNNDTNPPPDPYVYDTVPYLSHDDVGPTPYQSRLRFHWVVENNGESSYYWVRPFDTEEQDNYGEYSTDYADLLPEIGPIKPQTPSGQHGSTIPFSYTPNYEYAGPIVGQVWDFGDAGPPDDDESAAPTVTLTNTPGYYECW
jgi:hypothetical protein